jgi:hypothetical protein
MKSIEQVLFELVDLCHQLAIPYAVMGGIAVRIHGIPRPTYDVDIAVTAMPDQLEQLFDTAERVGYTIPEAYRGGWLDRVADMPLAKLRTYVEEGKGIDVDLFITESSFQESLMARRVTCDFRDRHIDVVSPEDLVLLKLLANRPRDLGDIQDIRFMQRQLDELPRSPLPAPRSTLHAPRSTLPAPRSTQLDKNFNYR